MYYRYKTTRRNRGIARNLFLIILIGLVSFFGYRYRAYLMFWKYTDNRLINKINGTYNIDNPDEKVKALQDLAGVIEGYKNKNFLQGNAFFLSGKIHFLLGEAYLAGSFSELVINEKTKNLNQDSRREFLLAIKDLNKGRALLNLEGFDERYSMMLAMACYFTGYRTPAEIAGMLEGFDSFMQNASIENIRFYSIIKILNNYKDQGLELLLSKGEVEGSLQGRLFHAVALKIAERYTNSIIILKDVLSSAPGGQVSKLIHVNLGEIYYTQRLYRESVEQFNEALNIDPSDNGVRIWLGKSYNASGDRNRAVSIWEGVLESDNSNKEVLRLLGLQ